MKITQPPASMPVPFGAAADPSTITVVPIPSQRGIAAGAASYSDGFPIETFLDPGAGGVAPRGVDFNGLLNAISQSIAWTQAGGQFPYSSIFQSSADGYPLGAVIQRSDATGGWISVIDQNMSNPDTGGAGWLPYGGATAPTSVTVSGADVTLSSLQAARPVIMISGTLSADVSVILPAWAAMQWLIVSSVTLGIYALTVKTAGGSGVSISNPSTPVYCDGTNILQSTTGGAGVSLSNTSPWTKNQYVTPAALASASTVTPDASTSNNFSLVLGEDVALANPDNLQNGMVLNFCIDQDATGGHAITFGSMYKWPGGTVPIWDVAPSAKNFFSAIYDGSILRCNAGTGYA